MFFYFRMSNNHFTIAPPRHLGKLENSINKGNSDLGLIPVAITKKPFPKGNGFFVITVKIKDYLAKSAAPTIPALF